MNAISPIESRNIEGLLIKHVIHDQESKDAADGKLFNWDIVKYTPDRWVQQLDFGYILSPCKYTPKTDGKYTHAGEYFESTHFFFADGDNFIGTDDATDAAIQPWIERDGIFDHYPSLKEKLYAFSESVSSMTKEKPHRRYRLIFLFDEPITTREQFNHVEKLLAIEFPIIPDIDRAPTQPVYGNARKQTKGTEIFGNVLSLKAFLDYPIPTRVTESLPLDEPNENLSNGNGHQEIPTHTLAPVQKSKDITLDEFIREQRIPTIKPRNKGGHFVECPWQSDHASGKNSDTDAYIWENQDGTFAFYCSHATCKKRGNSWSSYREAVAPKRIPQEQPTPPVQSKKEQIPKAIPPVIEFTSLQELEKKEFPEMKWVVDDLIPEGLTILAGAPKIGKSFFSWNLALAVSQAGIFLSEFKISKRQNVIYLALDNDPERQIQSRLKMIQPDVSLPENVQLCTNFPIRMQDEGLETWEETIVSMEADLVIVDTLNKVLKPEYQGSSYEQDYTKLGPVHNMVNRLGISMILVTHTRKMIDTENPYNMIQGSVGVQAACDNLILLTQSDGEKILKVTGREILEKELAVEISQGTFIATSVEKREESKLSDIRSEILAVVKEAGEPGINMKGIVEALPERSDNSVKLAVRRMVNEQIYQPKKRGKYYSSKPDEFQSEVDDIPL